MQDFHPPAWNEPLDLESYLASIPETSRVKGVFFRSAIQQAREATGQAPGRDKYHALSSYPSAELARVLAECAGRIYPNMSLRRGLRMLGTCVFPRLKETTAGGLIFGLAGRDLAAAIRLVGRAYKAFSTHTSARLASMEDNLAIIELRNVWTFPDCYHVGIFEGALKSYGKHGLVTIREHTTCDLDVQVYFV